MAALQQFASNLLRKRDKSVPPKLDRDAPVRETNANRRSENFLNLDFADPLEDRGQLTSSVSVPVSMVKTAQPSSSASSSNFNKDGKRHSVTPSKYDYDSKSGGIQKLQQLQTNRGLVKKASFSSVQEAAAQFGGKAGAAVPPIMVPSYPLSFRKQEGSKDDSLMCAEKSSSYYGCRKFIIIKDAEGLSH